MRIINGKYRSKRIVAPKNLPVRPTTDMAKEGLFNFIENDFHLDQLVVLDLFSGTGNISYEFASRGAKSVVAMDLDFNCVKFIKTTVKELGFSQVQVLRGDAFKYIKETKNQFKIIFADPPYAIENQDEMVSNIVTSDILVDEGWFIIEHDAHHKFDHLPGFVKQKRYGSVNFSVFEKIK